MRLRLVKVLVCGPAHRDSPLLRCENTRPGGAVKALVHVTTIAKVFENLRVPRCKRKEEAELERLRSGTQIRQIDVLDMWVRKPAPDIAVDGPVDREDAVHLNCRSRQ